jgi:phosphoglucosamine mutase
MRRHFGTDGVRGVANADLSPDLALRLGRAATRLHRERGVERPTVVVGRDTRRSGPMLEDALAAGVASAGGHVVRAGVLPTPGVAWLTRTERATMGVVISASHNPYPDNGIKLFGGDGYKLTDQEEARIEALLDVPFDAPTGAAVGSSEHHSTGAERYAAWVADMVDVDVSGLRVVVDCANGAAFEVAPSISTASASTTRWWRRRPTASTSTWTAARRTSSTWPTPSARAASTSAWPSTATPIGCSASTRRGRPSTATTCSPSWPASC